MSFPALTADKEDVTIEVKDSKGAVHAVKAVNLSKGDAKATFEFEKAVATADLTGKWTIGKASYDFDAIKQLEDIKSAVAANNTVKLLAALKAAGITDVADTDAALEAYVTEIEAADVTTLAEVQEAVAKANKDLADTDAADKSLTAVQKATGQVSLLNALQDGFKRVNADWIATYAGGKASVSSPSAANSVIGFITGNGNDVETQVVTTSGASVNASAVTPTNIQATIDAVNTAQIAQAWNTAWNSAKSEDLAKVTALVDYIPADTDAQKEYKEAAIDEAKMLEAVIKVNTVAASTATNGTFEKALQELDTLENSLVEKYKGTDYAVANKLDLETLKSTQLTEYRKDLKSLTLGNQKNQASDIQHVINKVNGLQSVALLEAVKAKSNITFATDVTEKAKQEADLLKAIKDLIAFDVETFKDVKIVDSRVASYAAKLKLEAASLNTSGLVAADNATVNTTVAKLVTVKTNLATAKTAITAANDSALTDALTAIEDATVSSDAEKAAFLKALQSPELALSNVIVANKDAYVENVGILNGAATVGSGTAQSAQKALQKAVNDVNALVAFNAAKTAEEAKTALDALKYAGFQDVDSADKVYVASKALEARDAAVKAGTPFTAVTDLTGALGDASTSETILKAYADTLATFALPYTKTSQQIGALEDLDVEAFNTSDKQDLIAEYFKKNFPTETVGGSLQSKPYTSLADVKADLEKAIEATK